MTIGRYVTQRTRFIKDNTANKHKYVYVPTIEKEEGTLSPELKYLFAKEHTTFTSYYSNPFSKCLRNNTISVCKFLLKSKFVPCLTMFRVS